MTQERGLAEYQPRELALPDEGYLRRELNAIRQFQRLAQQLLVKGHDFGSIPGTDKDTLLKPGAEKITKLLGLADTYEFVDRAEDWERPFFRYVIKCKLVNVATGNVVAESFGECNSYESRYRWRWVFGNQLPKGINKETLLSEERKSRKTGKTFTMYRTENEDIFSQVNTLVKMAQKRALVGAALSAGRLSEVFTQDMEDMPGAGAIDAEYEELDDASSQEPRGQQPTTMNNYVTEAQLRKIFGDAHRAGWTNEALKQHVETTYGVTSSKDLTKVQASELMEYIASGAQPAVQPVPAAQGTLLGGG